MEITQRNITLYTPGKKFEGLIDISNPTMRTMDLLNSANMYWKNPAEKSFDDALLLHEASVILDGDISLGKFEKMQLKLEDIFFFFDAFASVGDEKEKKRAATLKDKAKEGTSMVKIITHTRGHAFFFITGTFHGLFKNKTKQRYIPITEAVVVQILKHSEHWQKKQIRLDNQFIGVGSKHIEACSFQAN